MKRETKAQLACVAAALDMFICVVKGGVLVTLGLYTLSENSEHKWHPLNDHRAFWIILPVVAYSVLELIAAILLSKSTDLTDYAKKRCRSLGFVLMWVFVQLILSPSEALVAYALSDFNNYDSKVWIPVVSCFGAKRLILFLLVLPFLLELCGCKCKCGGRGGRRRTRPKLKPKRESSICSIPYVPSSRVTSSTTSRGTQC